MIPDPKLDEMLALAEDTEKAHRQRIGWRGEHWYGVSRERYEPTRIIHDLDLPFVAACTPEAIRDLILELKESRHLIKVCRDNPREEDAEEIDRLKKQVKDLKKRVICDRCGIIASPDKRFKGIEEICKTCADYVSGK